MEIVYYPEDNDDESGPIYRFLKNLKKERPPQLWVLVDQTLKKVERASNLKDLERQGWVERMPYAKVPLFEFRIPPGKRKAGVVRLYFAYKEDDRNTIVILSAEKKHGTSKADPEKINNAEKRYKEVCECKKNQKLH